MSEYYNIRSESEPRCLSDICDCLSTDFWINFGTPRVTPSIPFPCQTAWHLRRPIKWRFCRPIKRRLRPPIGGTDQMDLNLSLNQSRRQQWLKRHRVLIQRKLDRKGGHWWQSGIADFGTQFRHIMLKSFFSHSLLMSGVNMKSTIKMLAPGIFGL